MTRVKICGITNLADARAAVEAGADAIGLVFADSPRQIDAATARAIVADLSRATIFVGVFRDTPLDVVNRVANQVGLDCVQLHGSESPEFCALVNRCVIKRFKIGGDNLASESPRYRTFASLLDPGAGDGRTFDWNWAAGLPHRIIVAGGLTPENVAEPIRLLRPFGVDVASGVESSPGRKDHQKMAAFIQAVRTADADRA
jgi:phosphoribosylanthranilate isomerase